MAWKRLLLTTNRWRRRIQGDGTDVASTSVLLLCDPAQDVTCRGCRNPRPEQAHLTACSGWFMRSGGEACRVDASREAVVSVRWHQPAHPRFSPPSEDVHGLRPAAPAERPERPTHRDGVLSDHSWRRQRPQAALFAATLLLALAGTARADGTARAGGTANGAHSLRAPCRPAEGWRALPRPVEVQPTAEAQPTAEGHLAAGAMADHGETGATYAQQLRRFQRGWPVLRHWCVWLEPASGAVGAGLEEERWQQAALSALRTWSREVPLTVTDRAEAAQVRLWRRRPPLATAADGRQRASHGRALLTIGEALRDGRWWLEPRVEVLLSPGQGRPALQATALHELGHAFGLWGHSDQATDVMAVRPGATPLLELSARDQATLRWLLAQPTPFGLPQPESHNTPAEPAPKDSDREVAKPGGPGSNHALPARPGYDPRP